MKSDGKGVNNYGGGHSEGGGGNNGETGENEEQEVYQEEERQDCENQLKGETTEGKEQVGRKKNRWLISFVKLSQKNSWLVELSHFHCEAQVAGHSAKAFNGNFWDHGFSIFKAKTIIIDRNSWKQTNQYPGWSEQSQ